MHRQIERFSEVACQLLLASTYLHILHVPSSKLQGILFFIAQAALAGRRRLGVAAIDALIGVHRPLETLLDRIFAQGSNAVREDLRIVSDRPVRLSLVPLPTTVNLEMIIPSF